MTDGAKINPNALNDLPGLKNQYYLLRHGKSEANEAGIVVSSPEEGVPKYGLNQLGREQAAGAATKLYKAITSSEDYNGKNVIVMSSDFKRARETAEFTHKEFVNHGGEKIELRLSEALRERFFGKYDMTEDINYETVWENDSKDPWSVVNEVESVASVIKRVSEFVVNTCEASFEGYHIVLVAHGDVLRIAQNCFQKGGVEDEHKLSCLGNCGVVKLTLGATSHSEL
eukprot:Nk52_evm3s397 gene=Nk52_evmTU3s397